MKRRDFLKISGAVSAASVGAPSFASQHNPRFEYPTPKRLDDVVTQNGDILLRLKLSGAMAARQSFACGDIRVQHAKLMSISPYSFEAVDDIFDPTDASYRVRSNSKNADILMLRLRDVHSESVVLIKAQNAKFSFKLLDILINLI